MKSIFGKSLATALIFASLQGVAFAGIDKEPLIKEEAAFEYSVLGFSNTVKLRVACDHTTGKSVKIRILDEKGNVLADDYVKGLENFRRDYNLNAPGKGKYFVDIISGSIVERSTVYVGMPTVAEQFSVEFAESIKEDKFWLSLDNNMDGAYIRITDKSGKMFFSEYNSKKNQTKIYKLQDLPAGEYTVSVDYKDKTFKQTYVVE